LDLRKNEWHSTAEAAGQKETIGRIFFSARDWAIQNDAFAGEKALPIKARRFYLSFLCLATTEYHFFLLNFRQ
jgi:hypothetical protein